MQENKNKMQIQMRKWILEYIILLIFKDKKKYSWEIIKLLKENSIIIVEWTLYPLLNRLEKDKSVLYNREEQKNLPPRKYYRITKKWEKTLILMKEIYETFDDVIKKLEK